MGCARLKSSNTRLIECNRKKLLQPMGWPDGPNRGVNSVNRLLHSPTWHNLIITMLANCQGHPCQYCSCLPLASRQPSADLQVAPESLA